MDSILNSIKKMLGPSEEYTHFDTDLIIHINSVFATLTQLGVGPVEGYSITGDTETWDEFLGNEETINSVKSYMYLKVKLMFDPPSSSAVMQAMTEMTKEYEWRLEVAAN